MTKINESFSAFLDGEASELDIQRLLNAYEKNPEVAVNWHNLSSAQALLNNEYVSDAGLQLNGSAADHVRRASLKRWFPRSAVAALVAVTVTSGYWMTVKPNSASSVPQISVKQSEQVTEVAAAQQFEAQQRLQEFIKEHIEQASFTSGHGVIPSDIVWTQLSDTDE